MDTKAKADAEETGYVEGEPPLGPEGSAEGVRTYIGPCHRSFPMLSASAVFF